MEPTKRTFIEALGILVFMTIICGIYSFAITGIAQLFFPSQSNGSLIVQNGETVGSALIGQTFSGDQYLWGRAEIRSFETDAEGRLILSGVPSNMSPLSKSYRQLVSDRVANLTSHFPSQQETIPLDLVTGSGSGMDPDISESAAAWQVDRLVQTTGIPKTDLEKIIRENTKGAFGGVFGSSRVNVLRVNLAIRDRMEKTE